MLLFLLASGLTITFGLMRTLNLAHGGFYLVAGYLSYDIATRSSNFWVGLLVGVAVTTAVGIVFERVLLHRVRNDELGQIMVTIGFAFIIGDVVLMRYGGNPLLVPPPEWLAGSVGCAGVVFPKFRLAVIVVGLVVAAAIGSLLKWTKIGAKVRAAVDDNEIAQTVGVAVPRLFMLVFGIGTALAALAGVLGSSFIGLAVGNEFRILLLSIVVVVVGGLGSVKGAFIAALLVAFVDQYGKLWFPELALFTLYAPVALFLSFRPRGLFGTEA